jgi:hypothetical protein
MAPAVADATPAKRFCGTTAHGGAGLAAYAGSKTSCPFARAVGRRVLAAPTVHYHSRNHFGPFDWIGPKAGTYRVYSTAAHYYVRMHCRQIMGYDSPYEFCTGGNGARVWIYS